MSDEYPIYYSGAYGPEDAEAHRKVMEFLRTATEDELFATLVSSGYCDEKGHVLPPYADDVADEPAAG